MTLEDELFKMCDVLHQERHMLDFELLDKQMSEDIMARYHLNPEQFKERYNVIVQRYEAK